MLLQAVAVALTAAGLALCLDLEAVQRTTHFPQQKRSGGDDVGQRERIFTDLLSRRMAKLLPVLLRERDQEERKDWDDEDPTAGLRRNLLLPHSQRMTSRFAPVHGGLKRMAKKKSLGGRNEKKSKPSGNRRVPRLDGAMGTMKRRSIKAGERRQKGSLTKRDAKVLGELRQIFSDEQKPEQKTLQKREDVADLAKDESLEGKKNETDEEKFKKWLLDEYYRTMALSFASMRKKRMASSHQAPSFQTDGESIQDVDDDRFQAAEDRLRNMEEALLTEALALERGDAGGSDESRVAARLDAAYDLESVRRALNHLHSALRIIQMQEDQEGQSGSSSTFEAQRSSSNPQQCRVLQVLTSGCSALEDLLPVDAAFKARLITACNWHEVCYACGSLFDLTPEDCDEGFSDGDSGGQVLELLRERRAFVKRSAPAACSAPCVQEFLGSP